MKVGGNESATKFFQSHGGSAALANKDPKTKYTSNAATKYKDELTRRVNIDTQRHPNEVIVTDVNVEESSGTNTPAEPDDDFFSSWDKPTIKRPSNPPSRVGTPSQVNRTASPFLNSGANGQAQSRPKSPLNNGEAQTQAAPKAIPAAALRKGPTASAAPKKGNVLGAKKGQKLGAKKVTGAEDLDFDAAEKKAKEEAERIAKLGYDPNAEEPPPPPKPKSGVAEASNIASPTPVSPSGGFGQTQGHNRKGSDVERLGMGVTRLGFGQVGAPKEAKAGPKKMGFGAVGTMRGGTADDADRTARDKFGVQKSISSDEYFGRNQYDSNAQAEAKGRLQGFEGASSISSNAFFGRPEEDMPAEDYGDLETAAKDIIRKFGITAGDDLESISSLVGEGPTRLQGRFIFYQSEGRSLIGNKEPSGVTSIVEAAFHHLTAQNRSNRHLGNGMELTRI